MKPLTFMLIAGEPSGDLLGAELVQAIRREVARRGVAAGTAASPQEPTPTFEPRFFGAGGARMKEAGVELEIDLTAHSVIGFSDVVKNLLHFRRIFHQLLRTALARQPDAVICIDFSGFNRRLGHAIKRRVLRQDWFHNWKPRIIQYVSPQVWASREARAQAMARDFDLLLSTFPFEPEWYRQRTPAFRVEFVGNPIVDRHATASLPLADAALPLPPGERVRGISASPVVLLLPGSRAGELRRHLPPMLGAASRLKTMVPGLRFEMVLPSQELQALAMGQGVPSDITVTIGNLSRALAKATVAIASTGTVTLECAWFRVPTVAIYKTSWSTYQIAKRIVKVPFLAMPNLLAGEQVLPEFIQHQATPENIAAAAADLLRDPKKRRTIQEKLARVIAGLGEPGASTRAARAILDFFPSF